MSESYVFWGKLHREGTLSSLVRVQRREHGLLGTWGGKPAAAPACVQGTRTLFVLTQFSGRSVQVWIAPGKETT